MVRFAADENLNNHILRGLLRRSPDLDIVRVQDAGLSGAEDHEVLEWATREGRVLLTHDVSTMAAEAEKLIRSGTLPAGVLAIGRAVPVSLAIEDILLLAECSDEAEWEGQIVYLPLR